MSFHSFKLSLNSNNSNITDTILSYGNCVHWSNPDLSNISSTLEGKISEIYDLTLNNNNLFGGSNILKPALSAIGGVGGNIGNKYYDFTGTGTSKTLTTENAIFTNASGNFTMICWIKDIDFSSNKDIMGIYSADSVNKIKVETNLDYILYTYLDYGTDNYTIQPGTNGHTMYQNEWIMVSIIKSGTSLKLIINKDIIKEITVLDNKQLSNILPFRIGNNSLGTNESISQVSEAICYDEAISKDNLDKIFMRSKTFKVNNYPNTILYIDTSQGYSFNPLSSEKISGLTDLSIRGNHCSQDTLNNQPTFKEVSMYCYGDLYGSGHPHRFVTSDSTDFDTTTESFTLTVKVKVLSFPPDGGVGTSIACIIGKKASINNNKPGYVIYINNVGNVRAVFCGYNGSIYTQIELTTNPISKEEYHTITLLVDRDTNNKAALYVDGDLASSEMVIPTDFGSLRDNTYPYYFAIGKIFTESYNIFNGHIKKVHFCKSALTLTQIEAIHNTL